MLELKNINYTRDNKNILKDINLKFKNNKFYCITGPNGSGKSTLASIIMGIKRQDSGTIVMDDKDISYLNINERVDLGLAYAFQQPVKFKGITVYDLLNIAAKRKLSKKEACQILSKVGLCANMYLEREVNNLLSGGELKRIEIATVALKNAKITIFDEPEAGIDLWSFNNLIDVFREIKDIIKGTVIIISHQEKILGIADEIILLENGKVKKQGAKEEILGLIGEKKECCYIGGQVNE